MHAGFDPTSFILGLLGFPAALLAWQWIRARHTPTHLQATGIVGFTLNAAIFLALYLTRWYAPGWAFLSDAALLFYGVSMLLAALRGYAGVKCWRSPTGCSTETIRWGVYSLRPSTPWSDEAPTLNSISSA